LLVVAKLDKMPADRIEGTGFSPRVPDGTVKSQRLPRLNQRFEHALLLLQDMSAAKTGQRTKSTVTEPPGQLDGLIQMMTGADDIAEQEPQPTKMLAGHHHSGEIIQPRGDHQRGFLSLGEPLRVRLAPEIPPGRPRQFPGVWSVAALGRLADHAKQDMLFILKPIGRLCGPSDFLKHDTRLRRGPRSLGLAGIEETRSHGGSVQVVVKHAVHRGPPAGFALTGARLLRRVGAQQAMTGVAAGNVLREQMLVTQLCQR
jgi:hypothetical protein